MEVERQIRRDEEYVDNIDEAKPKFCSFDDMGENAAEIAYNDDDHEHRRFAVNALCPVSFQNRERPGKAEGLYLYRR